MGFLGKHKPAPIPSDEELRLSSLHALDLLDTPPDANYDAIVELAKDIFDVPIALISFVEDKRQWFKSCIGLNEKETSRDVAFCAHAILQSDVLVVKDATQDERFKFNPLVTGYPYIRFYAGAQLRAPNGQKVGTLCIIDYQPRPSFSKRDAKILRDLGRVISTLLIAKQPGAENLIKTPA